MFSFRKKDAAPLQVYGKLPLAKDYLRIGCSQGGALALRGWLDQAFSGSAEKSAQPVLPWPMRFLLGGPAPLIGCAWPSSDAGGLRRFPFAMMVDRKKRALQDDLRADWSSCETTWRRLEELHRDNASRADGRDFLAALRGVQVDPSEPEVPERVQLEAWTKGLFGEEGERGLSALLEALRGVDAGARQPIRLPLVSDLPPTVQVQAWWGILRELRLAGSEGTPSLFFPQPGSAGTEPAYVTAFTGPLGVADAEWLTSLSAVPLAESDLAPRTACTLGESAPTHENLPPLVDSLRGVLVGLRGR
jgi:hypothetical protein